MLGLFATLNLGTRALQTQQQGVEVTGHNLANVNNSAYSRQQLVVTTSAPLETAVGSQGTGVQVAGVEQARDWLVDQQIQAETSVTGSLEAQQRALEMADTALGEQLSSSTSSTHSTDVGSRTGLANGLSDLFNAFQELSASPSSLSARQSAIAAATQLSARFNQVDTQLDSMRTDLNTSIEEDVSSANDLLKDIADLNQQIVSAELGSAGTANDLRDLRQQKIETLANLANVQTAATSSGAVNITIGGTLMVSGGEVSDSLETYDAGGGQILLRSSTDQTPLTLTGGSIQGTIDARDTSLASLQTDVNNLAAQLINEVNSIYRGGYDLAGGTGADFFTGNDAGDIAVNTDLVADPSKFQASGNATASGDNTVALALAQLGDARQSGLGNLTFADSYNRTLTDLGLSISSVDSQLEDQQVVASMLAAQRNSISGVSLEEEMTNLVTYQRAFQASARLVSTIDEMLNEVVNLK